MNTATLLTTEAPAVQEPSGFTRAAQAQSLRGCVEQAMENYFQNLDGQEVSDVYDMVMAEVEAPMLEIVLKYTRHNQTRAAQVLGLNRGTLRKKLKQYGLL
ncbi:DNA-binding transcriptional regulator Fis [Cellvibrio polysaccharolyticus]|jgi:Fis family transcriptional regulator|uniref:Putative Fis-like DNA-binding protein n=1 Tax=Cellvibrio polysaccharolyticus TaxID=2082724 RepID=A0A928YTB7_9GAMM|nr:DNA-binding transcriptional regulator Fis [Cellvibrio polysaccharolyticus]MBE8716697.1 DNA-binding transcriptional regulator Fis [Cellvibrio polysaccharolyticus]